MDYYKILEVNSGSSFEVIKAAYKVLAKKYHPDVYQGDKAYAERMMQKINAAYEVLSNPELRAEYDRANFSSPKTEPETAPASEAEESYEQAESLEDRIFCPECGKSNPADAAFCIFCGSDLFNKPFPAEPYETVSESSYDRDVHKTNHFLIWAAAVIFIPLAVYLCIRIPSIQSRQSGEALDSMPVSSLSEQYTAIDLLKTSYLANYSQTKSIGDAFDSFFRDPEWMATIKNGVTNVGFQGTFTDTSKNITQTTAVVFTKNGASFQITSWRVDGMEQTEEQISSFLKKIFEQEASAP